MVFLLTAVGNENAGYLANTLPDGAQNIYLALSTNDNNTLDKSNKIVPADPQQKSGAFAGKRGQRRPVHLLRWLCFANAEKRHQRADYQLGNVGISL
nr:hypothetical protein [Escherichia coli]